MNLSMIGVLVALVTQTYEGNMSVVPNLSDHDCAEAVCIAERGLSCEKAAAKYKASADAYMADILQEETYFKEHPKSTKYCPAINSEIVATCYYRDGGESITAGGTYFFDQTSIKTAECVK